MDHSTVATIIVIKFLTIAHFSFTAQSFTSLVCSAMNSLGLTCYLKIPKLSLSSFLASKASFAFTLCCFKI